MNEPMNQVLGPPRDGVSQRHLAGQNTIDCLYARMGKGVAVEVDVQFRGKDEFAGCADVC